MTRSVTVNPITGEIERDPFSLNPWPRSKPKKLNKDGSERKKPDKARHGRLVSALVKYLTVNGFYAREVRVQSIRLPGGGYAKSASKGVLDIFVALPRGRYAWIDAKCHGDSLTPEQSMFICKVHDMGGLAFAVHNVDELKTLLEANGVTTREVK